MSLILKYAKIQTDSIETSTVILLAYSSYLLSNTMQFSGIVSLLFCGMTTKHYTVCNLSKKSKAFLDFFFHLVREIHIIEDDLCFFRFLFGLSISFSYIWASHCLQRI